MKERTLTSHCKIFIPAIHIEMVNLVDGDYEPIPANCITPESAVVNCANLNQDQGQAPEEPQASSAQEGKPRCIIPLFFTLFTSNYSLYVIIILFVHLRS